MVDLMPLRKPQVSPSSPVPVWRQLAAWIREAVETGELAPGEKLPAWRDLADEWGVGHNTVEKAVRQLVSEGLLASTQGKGTFVAEPPALNTARQGNR